MGMAAAESQFHVLAVDDSLIDRKLIERLFKTSSCQVTTVDSGSKALEFLGIHEHDENSQNQPFISSNHPQDVEVNLVITDYCMPGMTGYDLLKKIKESSYLRNIPVVIMSSENVPSRINRCLEEGAEEFFLKPVRLADVNKLRPHMMKTKAKTECTTKKPENDSQEHQERSTEQPLPLQEIHECPMKDAPSECSTEDVELQPQNQKPEAQTEEHNSFVIDNNNNNNDNNNENKRKAAEDCLSPERTRPRYNALTAFSNL